MMMDNEWNNVYSQDKPIKSHTAFYKIIMF